MLSSSQLSAIVHWFRPGQLMGNPMTELQELALDAAVAPPGILSCKPDDELVELNHFGWDRRRRA
jgi:hypothetical protein